MSRNIATQDIMLQAAGMFTTDEVSNKYIDGHRASHPLVLYTKGDLKKNNWHHQLLRSRAVSSEFLLEKRPSGHLRLQFKVPY